MILDVTYCIFGIDDLLFGAIIMAVASIGSTIASGVSNKRSRDSQATINQANLQNQKEINQQNIDLQKSAVPDRFNQLTSLGMSRQAALQAVSGASYSPSAVATTQQAYQEQPLDFSQFGTLANLMQASAGLTEQKRMNDAQLELMKEQLERSRIETWEKQYGKASVEVRDKIMEYIFGDNNLSLSDIDDVPTLMSKLPDDLRREASKYNIPATVLSDMIRDYKTAHMESVQLKMLHTEDQLKEIELATAISDADLKMLKNQKDMEQYPILAEINLEACRAAMQKSKADATYADLMVEAQLTQEQALALSAMLDEQYYKEHPKQEKFLRGLKRWLDPIAGVLGGASQGVSTAIAVRGMNKKR